MLRKKQNQNLVLNQKMFFKKATEGAEKAEKKKNRRKQRWANESEREEGKSRNDRLTQQWGVERVVLLVAMGTQDTFNLHIWCHEWGRGHLWQKLLPWLLASCT